MVKAFLGIALIVGSLWLAGAVANIDQAQAQDTAAQGFPASAVIRGENIRLRADAASQSDDVAIMARGDEITITGEAVAADGDLFYPIQLNATGESGWVRTIFIDPKSIVPVLVVEKPAAADKGAAKPDKGQNQNQNKKKKKNAPADVTPTPEPAPDATAADRAARRAQREADAAAAQADTGTPVPAATLPAAEAATPTPAAAAPAAPSAAAITIGGEGAETSAPFTLAAGSYRVVGSLLASADGDFTARLLDADANAQRLFKETIAAGEAWSGETTIDIATAGEFTVKVSGITDVWTIAFDPA